MTSPKLVSGRIGKSGGADEKPQAPSTKLQRSSKHQSSSAATPGAVWRLEIVASLELGTWCLGLPASIHQSISPSPPSSPMLIFDQLKKNDPHLRALGVVILCGFGVLLAGLWWVQIVSSRDYQAN